MKIRAYEPADCTAMADLFYETVHVVNAGDYTREQLDVWADGHVDLTAWDRSFRNHDTVVAVEDDILVGFADMDSGGYLDRLYVHKDYQRKGIAAGLCSLLEKNCLEKGTAEQFYTHASITARAFFEGRGYEVEQEQQVERGGIYLTNYVMKKPVPPKRRIVKDIRDQELLRCSFMNLAVRVFGFSFHQWYEDGYWTDKYIPYAYCEGNKVIANVSVNLMDFLWEGERRRFIQLGTVMTDPDYRNQGLSRRLIEEVLHDYEGRCDGFYLFANDKVLDFYPRFGFEKKQEFKYGLTFSAEQMRKGAATLSTQIKKEQVWRQLDMTDSRDLSILYRCYGMANPYSALSFTQNEGLLMFYCSAFMKDCVYYIEALDMVVIAEREEVTLPSGVCSGEREEMMICHDIYGQKQGTIKEVMCLIADTLIPSGTFSENGHEVIHMIFGFTPAEASGMVCSELTEENTLFVLAGKEMSCEERRLLFPTLSHA